MSVRKRGKALVRTVHIQEGGVAYAEDLSYGEWKREGM